MNFYPFHIGDYAVASRTLSLMEDLAYRRLLDLYYSKEHPIPDDIDRISRLIGMREHKESVTWVLSEFFLISDLKSERFYRNKRCDAEIAKYQAKSLRAKNANNSRWAKEKSEIRSGSDLKSDADQIPTKNQEPRQAISSRPASPGTRKKISYEPQDFELAEIMWTAVDQLAGNQKKPNLENWANTIRLARKNDGRTIEELKSLFFWANNHSFWRMNIRSPDTLRKKFDDLNVRMSNETRNGPSKSGGMQAGIDHESTEWVSRANGRGR